MNDSLRKGWNRACHKCSSETVTLYSPITNTEARLINSTREYKNKYLKYFILPTELSEENYYQNTLILILNSKNSENNLVTMLRSAYTRIDWSEVLTNFFILGKGNFGTVWQAENKNTGELYAVKTIIPDSDSYYYFQSILSILNERNILEQLNDSPYIVRLRASFQPSDRKSFWLVMEYCPMSLQNFIERFMPWNVEQISVKFFKGKDIVTEIKRTMDRTLKVNYHSLIFLYLFEVMAALHYLGDRHIVHCDIKPDNILISAEGHIKLADLGVSKRFRPIDKESSVVLLYDFEEIKDLKEIDTKYEPFGNSMYEDPEIFFRRSSDSSSIDDIATIFDDFPTTEKETRQTFLSDVYSVGVIITELLLGNVNINIISDKIKEYLENSFENIDLEPWKIVLCYNNEIFEKVIINNITPFIDRKYRTALGFLFSTLKPRKERIIKFRKKQKVLRYKDINIEESVDIDQVKLIRYYLNRRITTYTTRNISFPSVFLDLFKHEDICGMKQPNNDDDVFDERSHFIPEFYFNSIQ